MKRNRQQGKVSWKCRPGFGGKVRLSRVPVISPSLLALKCAGRDGDTGASPLSSRNEDPGVLVKKMTIKNVSALGDKSCCFGFKWCEIRFKDLANLLDCIGEKLCSPREISLFMIISRITERI